MIRENLWHQENIRIPIQDVHACSLYKRLECCQVGTRSMLQGNFAILYIYVYTIFIKTIIDILCLVLLYVYLPIIHQELAGTSTD